MLKESLTEAHSIALSAMLSNRAAASQACALLKTLANEDRLLILCQLIEGEKTSVN